MKRNEIVNLTGCRGFSLGGFYSFADLCAEQPQYKNFLGQRSKRWALVVDCVEKDGNTSLSKKDVEDFCKHYSNAISFWFIVHDRDVKEDGTKALTHYHIILEYGVSVRASTLLTAFYTYCNTWIIRKVLLDGQEVLTLNPWLNIEPVKNLWGALRYLVHADNLEKFPYSIDEVISNEPQRFETAIALQDGLTADNLLYLYADKCNFSRLGLMSALGLDLYKKYRPLLDDIDNELKSRIR